jgi:uncharacterized protein (TIGR03437 family)
LVRYSKLNDLVAGVPPNFTVPDVARTLAVTTDSAGALYVADGTNRVAIYYQALQAINGANFIPARPLAPALIASICSLGSNCVGGDSIFPPQPVVNDKLPVPNVLGDVQVTVNGTSAPLFYVSQTQLNFQVPGNAPTAGQANIEVVQKSTGQVLAAGQAQMSNISPGIFMQQYTGTQRQAAVLNEDNTINSSTNPAQRGHLIQIFATGQGAIPGLPADGNPPSGLVVVPKTRTNVLIGVCFLAEGSSAPINCPNQPGDVQSGSAGNWIPFSGLSPQFPGVWQINAQIPMAVPPNNGPVVLKVLIDQDPTTDNGGFTTIIYVK